MPKNMRRQIRQNEMAAQLANQCRATTRDEPWEVGDIRLTINMRPIQGNLPGEVLCLSLLQLVEPGKKNRGARKIEEGMQWPRFSVNA